MRRGRSHRPRVLTPAAPGGGGGGPVDEDRDQLVPADLALAGQFRTRYASGEDASKYAFPAFAIRYVGGQRRYLTVSGWPGVMPNGVHDLVEFKEPTTGIKNGGSHWNSGNVPDWEETRRWVNWSTIPRINAGQIADDYPYMSHDGVHEANGIAPAAFHWIESQSVLMYSFIPNYPGGPQVWPSFNAVRLLDAEAVVVGDSGTNSNEVDEANILGPYYFKDDTTADIWKGANCGIIDIPTNRQAAMGGKYILAGHHQANIGTVGPRSVMLWVVGDLPDFSSPPAQDAVIFTDAVKLYDTSTDAGVTPPNMKLPNFSFQAMYHSNPGSTCLKSIGGTFSVFSGSPTIGSGEPVPTAQNDAFYDYIGDYDVDCITVRMTEPAVGASFVPQYYNGSTWVTFTSWAMAAGDANLSTGGLGSEGFHAFYWPKVTTSNFDPPDGSPSSAFLNHRWVRLLQTSASCSDGGSLYNVVCSMGEYDALFSTDRPAGAGGYDPLGSEQYDSTHYSYAYEAAYYGGAWVRTDYVEGFPYFGPMGNGGLWYGSAPCYGQPYNGGTPTFRVHSAVPDGAGYGNGGRGTGSLPVFLFPFSTTHLLEAVAGTGGRQKNNTGINPVSFTNLHDLFPDIILSNVVTNVFSDVIGEPNHNMYGWGQTTVWDPVAKQVIVQLRTLNTVPIVVVLGVRNNS